MWFIYPQNIYVLLFPGIVENIRSEISAVDLHHLSWKIIRELVFRRHIEIKLVDLRDWPVAIFPKSPNVATKNIVAPNIF